MAITTNCLMFDNQQLLYDGTGILYNYDPLNPLNLPPYTIRLLYKNGVTPTFNKGTGIQVSQSPNIWDLTYTNSNWYGLLESHEDLLEVLGGNTTGVTNMSLLFCLCSNLERVSLFDTSMVGGASFMFWNCVNLVEIPLFDTSNVTHFENMFDHCFKLSNVPFYNTSKGILFDYMFAYCYALIGVPLLNTENTKSLYKMFFNCTSLTSIPLLNTNKVTDISEMCNGCINVQSGALALYNQVSSQANPPSEHLHTFTDCGANTQTGAAELAQIPSDWK